LKEHEEQAGKVGKEREGMWEWEKYGKWRTEWYKNKKENGKIGTHVEKNEKNGKPYWYLQYSIDGAVNTGYLRY
jgi:hypothetical protein